MKEESPGVDVPKDEEWVVVVDQYGRVNRLIQLYEVNIGDADRLRKRRLRLGSCDACRFRANHHPCMINRRRDRRSRGNRPGLARRKL